MLVSETKSGRKPLAWLAVALLSIMELVGLCNITLSYTGLVGTFKTESYIFVNTMPCRSTLNRVAKGMTKITDGITRVVR
jgi:hypothetical protein